MDMGQGMDENQWTRLLKRIRVGKCTPFLGAGVNFGILPLGGEIALQLAQDYGYPLEDRYDLARVTQFLAINHDAMYPKEEILDLLQARLSEWEKRVTGSEFYSAPDEALSVLAELPISIYMTTNYDDLLIRALKYREKEPSREICLWNRYVREKLEREPSVFDSASGVEPSPVAPVVFYLHGHDEVPESLVLTEDDYINFLVNISRRQDLLPPRIQEALAGTTLLFIGYRLADWDFRVLFQGLLDTVPDSLRRLSVAVQIPPDCQEQDRQRCQQEYLKKYFGKLNVQVYWGTAKDFATELGDRWRKFVNDN
jgi:hypothetical protein